MLFKKNCFHLCVYIFFLFVSFSSVRAAEVLKFPSKPIRIIAPFATKDKILAMHQELVGSSQESFEKKFKSDIEKISKLIKDLGIPIQD